MPEAKLVTFEDARIIYRNFAGKEGQYNREGDRNFSVVLDQETADVLHADGWNIKTKDPREEGDDPFITLPVAVNFQNRPPRVVMITSGGRIPLDEATIEILDYADVKVVDLVVRGYDWNVNGKEGTKAYLKTMFITIDEDDLERKYAMAAPVQPAGGTDD